MACSRTGILRAALCTVSSHCLFTPGSVKEKASLFDTPVRGLSVCIHIYASSRTQPQVASRRTLDRKECAQMQAKTSTNTTAQARARIHVECTRTQQPHASTRTYARARAHTHTCSTSHVQLTRSVCLRACYPPRIRNELAADVRCTPTPGVVSHWGCP